MVLISGCYPNGAEFIDDIDLVYTNYSSGFAFSSKQTYAIPDSVIKITGDVFNDPDGDHKVDLVPDLVVEVLSRSTEARDRGRKMAVFARHELPEYWLVDAQARELEVYARSAGSLSLIRVFESGHRVTSATLPGLSFDLDRLFTD